MALHLSRRELLLAGAGLSFPPYVSRAFAHSHGLDKGLPAVVDSSVHTTSEAQALKDRGAKVIIRYYALGPQGGGLEQKRLEDGEANILLNQGLSIAISYQYKNGIIDSFTPERARKDALTCVRRASEIAQPKGSAIYFGVDQGWDDEDSIKKVSTYFKTINEVFEEHGNPVEVGIYGSGLMCSRMQNLAKFFWIAGLSDAWPGRPQFVKSRKWNLYQNILEASVGSIKIDTDVVNPKAARIGSFHRLSKDGPTVLDEEISDQKSFETYRFVKGNTALLYDKPGAANPKPLAASKMVSVVREEGQYSIIDVPRQIGPEHNKRADFVRGYCRANQLVRIDEDPT